MDKIVKNIAFVALISAAVWPAQAGAMAIIYLNLGGQRRSTASVSPLDPALNEALKDPAGKFDAFVKEYEEAGVTLTDAIDAISSYSAAQNPEFFDKFFAWIKNQDLLKYKEKHEVKPDMKWFYLDLTYQADNVRVKHKWLKKCFEYLEATTDSVFDAAVTQFITEQIKKQDEQKQWAAILLEKNKIMQQKKIFETCKNKLVVNGIIKPENPSLFKNENKKKNFFDDIDFHFTDE